MLWERSEDELDALLHSLSVRISEIEVPGVYWVPMADFVITGQIPPTIYYARVGMELSKLVFKGQKMAPP